MKATIIGAGIGGLTAAIALQSQGIDVEIFEAAPELRPVGAGIFMACNAMQVFQKLGIAGEIENAGKEIEIAYITDQRQKPIGIYHFKEKISKKYGAGNLAMTRARLQEVLLNHIPKQSLNLGKRLQDIKQHTDHVSLTFTDGTTTNAEIVLAADGIHSAARKYVAGEISLRYSKQTCWRGISNYPLPIEIRHHNFEIWGDEAGLRFGFGSVWENEVYWFSTAAAPEGQRDATNMLREKLLSLYHNFGPIVRGLIDATETSSIIRSDLHDFKPTKTWWKDRVVLLGDAAHATTPNLGQGGCQAIEDGWAIAQCLKKYPDPSTAFASYQQYRYAKAKKVVDLSWTFNQFTNIRQPWLRLLRNSSLRWMPESMNFKLMDPIFRINPI